MPVLPWAAGDTLYAAGVLEWLQPKAACKTADQSVTSSTTLVNDTQLSLAVSANAVYKVDLGLLYTSPAAAGDIKIAWTGPTGAALSTAICAGLAVAAVTASDDITVGASAAPAFGGVGSNTPLHYVFLYTTSAAAGTLQLQWAQNTSSTTPTTVQAGSYLTAQRIG